jgi:hypothetical protein
MHGSKVHTIHCCNFLMTCYSRNEYITGLFFRHVNNLLTTIISPNQIFENINNV